MRVAPKLACAAALLASFGTASPARAAVNLEATPQRAQTLGFASPIVVAARSEPFTFLQMDNSAPHNMISAQKDADGFPEPLYGPDDAPWCGSFQVGGCPLFWSGPAVTVSPGGGYVSSTLDLSNVVAGQTYLFVCEIHPYMTGQLKIVS